MSRVLVNFLSGSWGVALCSDHVPCRKADVAPGPLLPAEMGGGAAEAENEKFLQTCGLTLYISQRTLQVKSSTCSKGLRREETQGPLPPHSAYLAAAAAAAATGGQLSGGLLTVLETRQRPVP